MATSGMIPTGIALRDDDILSSLRDSTPRSSAAPAGLPQPPISSVPPPINARASSPFSAIQAPNAASVDHRAVGEIGQNMIDVIPEMAGGGAAERFKTASKALGANIEAAPDALRSAFAAPDDSTIKAAELAVAQNEAIADIASSLQETSITEADRFLDPPASGSDASEQEVDNTASAEVKQIAADILDSATPPSDTPTVHVDEDTGITHTFHERDNFVLIQSSDQNVPDTLVLKPGLTPEQEVEALEEFFFLQAEIAADSNGLHFVESEAEIFFNEFVADFFLFITMDYVVTAPSNEEAQTDALIQQFIMSRAPQRAPEA